MKKLKRTNENIILELNKHGILVKKRPSNYLLEGSIKGKKLSMMTPFLQGLIYKGRLLPYYIKGDVIF